MKIAARSAPRPVGEARPTRLRRTPSQATPNPTPVAAVPPKKKSGALSATPTTVRANPAARATAPHLIALAAAHERATITQTAPIQARRAIASPPRVQLCDAGSDSASI